MIAFRNASHRSGPYGTGRLIRRVEATWGAITACGANKTAAKTALIEAVERQLEHVYSRRYLSSSEVTFVLFYANGWCYDIVKAGDARGGTCHLDAVDERDAFERMRRHFEQYTECSPPDVA